MKVLKTEVDGMVYVVLPEDFRNNVVPEIEGLLEDMVLDDLVFSEIKIRVCDMEKAEFGNLPEFEGW